MLRFITTIRSIAKKLAHAHPEQNCATLPHQNILKRKTHECTSMAIQATNIKRTNSNGLPYCRIKK